jgi:hypothetical protein
VEAVMVEVVGRFGQVRARHKLTRFPATLGRAPSSDVVLEEADVSANHARVVRADDGTLALEDLGSSNGVRLARKRVARVVLGPVTDVRLGSAHLRFVALDAPVPKTTLFRLSRLDRWAAVGLGFAAFALSVVLEEWYLKSTRVRPSEVVETVVALGVMVVGGWAFVWSLASRVAHGKSKVLGHLAAGFFAFAGFQLIDQLFPYVTSVLRLPPLASDLVTGLAVDAVLGWLVFQNLSRVVTWRPRRLVVTVLALLALVSGVAVTTQVANAGKYSSALPLSQVQPPPALLLGPVASDADLHARIAALQKAADAAKKER